MKTFTIFIPDSPFARILLIVSFFVFAACFAPVIGSLFLLFLPLPLLFYSGTSGKIKATVAFLIPLLVTFLISYFLQIKTISPLILIMGIVGLAMSAIALKNRSIEKTLIYPALIIIGVIFTYFLYTGWQLTVNPWHVVSQFVTQMIEQNIDFYSQLPLDKEDINFLKNNKQPLINFFVAIFPALVVTGSAVIIWINILIGRNILRKAGINLSQLENLAHWSAPDFIIWIFLAAGGLLLIPHEQIRFFGLNLLIVICFIYLLQGLAIISFIFQNKNVPLFFRFLLYFLIAVQQFLMIPIVALGLFDIWVDFRRFFQPGQTAA